MSDEVHGHVFDDGDVLGSVAGAQAVGKKPVEVVADPVSALFEPTMIGVDGVEDPAVWGIGGIGEEGLDLGHEGGPVGLQREQIEHRQPWRGPQGRKNGPEGSWILMLAASTASLCNEASCESHSARLRIPPSLGKPLTRSDYPGPPAAPVDAARTRGLVSAPPAAWCTSADVAQG
jgi:hypothetical protein